MFDSIRETIDYAVENNMSFADIMVKEEMELSGKSRDEVRAQMKQNLDVMRDAVIKGTTGDGVESVTGYTGHDAAKLRDYNETHAIAGDGIGDTDIPWPYSGFDNYPFIQENYWELSTGIETPKGQDVKLIDPKLGIEVRFEDVIEAGKTKIVTSKTGPELEQEFRKVGDYCILETTAESSEAATIELGFYYGLLDVKNPDKLKLKHYNEKDDTWTDITKEVDTSAEMVKGLMPAKDLNSILVLMEPVIISATIDIDPDTLNLKSNGEFLTAYIKLPEGYSVTAIDTSTVQLEDIPAIQDPAYGFVSAPFIDYDGDGILECMVKFDRSLVRDTQTGLNDYEESYIVYELVLTLTGTVDIISFEGSDTIKVIQK